MHSRILGEQPHPYGLRGQQMSGGQEQLKSCRSLRFKTFAYYVLVQAPAMGRLQGERMVGRTNVSPNKDGQQLKHYSLPLTPRAFETSDL